ncbi:hypothetical protein ABG067_000623 [Albugo candida]|uniref:E3 ubiquitin-protein ligase CHFR n=1 Tax=Albugo candida TaxID=65357 RepID=A0A024GG39_9STRA|nr:unnamed protein product [Albugo candida]|eukprot:CCI45305.1 unnamed protein product [Albugo candida]
MHEQNDQALRDRPVITEADVWPEDVSHSDRASYGSPRTPHFPYYDSPRNIPNTIPSRNVRPLALFPETTVPLARISFLDSFTVGRSRKCELSIFTSEQTRTVSKFHVRIFPSQTLKTSQDEEIEFYPCQSNHNSHHETSLNEGSEIKWILQDLSSLNGTSINGEQVTTGSSKRLFDGDDILLSSVVARQSVRLRISFADERYSRIILSVFARVNNDSVQDQWTSIDGTAQDSRNLETDNSYNNHIAAISADRQDGPSFLSSPRIINTTTAPSNRYEKKRDGNESTILQAEKAEETLECCENPTRKRGRHCIKELNHMLKNEDDERFLICSICLEYFQRSVTLDCSHTFCGFCVGNWFRTSLSCPQCRGSIKLVPVRNRALDDLVQRLVGTSPSYRATTMKRLNEQEAYISGKKQLFRLSGQTLTFHSIWRHRWTKSERDLFHSFLEKQFGERREMTCHKVGLTEETIGQADLEDLLRCASNLNLDTQSTLSLSMCQLASRIKIYLYFG